MSTNNYKSNNSRYETLRNNISNYFKEELNIELVEELNIEKLFGLKSVLSNINNMITYKASACFVEWLKKKGIITEQEKKNELNRLDATSANANGFDINISTADKKIILAEVKCNIPINNSSGFGSAQRNGILSDMQKLAKTKGDFKFMVLLDNEKVKSAFCEEETFIKYLNNNGFEKDKNFVTAKNTKELDMKKINVVFVKIN